jgi:RNA-binding protein NOB1
MLGKVSVFINDDGEITYFDNPRRRINLRGTKYSLPKPKFGRHAPQLILREDQLMTGQMAMRRREAQNKKKKEEAAMKNTL